MVYWEIFFKNFKSMGNFVILIQKLATEEKRNINFKNKNVNDILKLSKMWLYLSKISKKNSDIYPFWILFF